MHSRTCAYMYMYMCTTPDAINLSDPGRPVGNARWLKQPSTGIYANIRCRQGSDFFTYTHVHVLPLSRERSPAQPRLIIHKGRKKRGGNCLLCLNVVTPLVREPQLFWSTLHMHHTLVYACLYTHTSVRDRYSERRSSYMYIEIYMYM